MGDKNIANNPFAALFPSLSQAEQYRANFSGNQKTVSEVSCIPGETETTEKTVKEEQVLQDEALRAVKFSEVVEQIFLITLDKECSPDVKRPSRCVFLEEMASTLQGQTWFDSDCLRQAVFERVMLENPAANLVTVPSSRPDVRAAAAACERDVLRYLFQCYSRICAYRKDNQLQDSDILCECEDIILMNAHTCLQQTELFATQKVHQQFLDIYQEEFEFMAGGLNKTTEDFFQHLCSEIDANREDGSLLEVFKPVLDQVKDKFTNELSLVHADTLYYVSFMEFFAKSAPLAEAFMAYNAPWDWKNGRAFEMTLVGSALSLTCIPKNERGPYQFFNNPSSTPKQEHDITESNIWQPLSNLCERIHQLFLSIIKLSPNLRHTVLTWLGRCLQANAGRTKIWSNQIPQLFNQMYCSEGFSLNLCHVMLKLCQPFSDPGSLKLLKIQPSYAVAVAANKEEVKTRGLHAGGLSTETKLVQVEENELQPAPDTVYSFITECFFLTQQCLNLGFHMVHDKFLKLNQDLHRVQRLYTDMRGQSLNEDQEPIRSVKAQMEKGMTLFLSMKAALTEPKFMEMSNNFHLATAAWLAQVAVHHDLSKFKPITFPLSEEVPPVLGYIPEFLMGNLTDFVLFCQRFKDDMFQFAGERVNHLMTLILVFMGSPERMKNPHLRAELADLLAALMPDKNNSGRSGLLSSFHREQLFIKHPLVSQLSTTLLHVFVSIEMTGQSVEFEQKFNYRRPMYQVLEYIWEIDIHKDAIKILAVEAEKHIEDTDPPLFLRFVNLLINDAIFLLDEALQYMSQIKEKQQEKERGDWEALDQRQRQETESNFRHLGMLARYHNVMANYTIHSLELLTQEIQSIFCHSVLVDRIAGMLNYFLLHLVGPKQRSFNVKDKNEYEFKPQQIVQDITKIYLNLGDSEEFSAAVSNDERSYSPELFAKAVQVLQKISTHPQIVSNFLGLEDKIRALAESRREEEERLVDAPEEFLDPIMGTLMRDPVLLPSSKNIVDKGVIARHILSDQSDPFNRSPLSLEMVEPQPELKARIEEWIAKTKSKSEPS